jgi:ammonia channel protein AmtB
MASFTKPDIGLIAGIIVVYGVTILERVFRVDDPVGAVPVHLMNGVFSTLTLTTGDCQDFRNSLIKQPRIIMMYIS